MDENDMDDILEFYEPGTVPAFQEIHSDPVLENFTFDGSFGWWL